MTDQNSNNNESSKMGLGRQGAHKDPDSIPEEDTLCCCPPICAPSWLQGLANIKVFTFHMMITISFAMMSFVYLGAVLTTIERNFQLDSAKSGAITIAADVVSTLFVMPLSHYGQMGHRPRWIGTGMMMTAVGTLLCAMPHFVSDPIDPNVILTGSVDERQELCSADGDELSKYETSTNASLFHDTGDFDDHGSLKGDLRKVWWIILGQLISGIGNAPFSALVATYIDDSVKKHTLTTYTAVMFMAFTFGPSCGFLFAAFTTSMYVDFDRVPSDQIPGISQNDPRWIGAWWLGFVILSIIIAILSIPIFFYPRTMASAVKKWKEEKKEAEAEEGNKLNGASASAVTAGDDDDGEDNDLKERRGSIYVQLDDGNAVETIIKGPLLALKRLFCNPTNMCLVVYETALISLIAITAAFGVKYTETQFLLSPSQAALITAIVLGPSNIISNIFSAYVCRKFKLNSKQCALFALVCAAIGFILYPVGMLLGCDTIPIAGLTASYDGSRDESFASLMSCNMNCTCSEEVFQPVCGSNGLTYISPCHAGCKDVSYLNMTTAETNPLFQQEYYSQCSCITNSSTNSESRMNILSPSSPSDDVEASSGPCPDPNCMGAIPITILLCAIVFVESAASNPLTYVALRCVREEDRSMAIALRSVSAHFLGFLPAPIFFGAIINSVCIHWQVTDGDRGSCWVYDNRRYRMAYYGVIMVLQGVALLSIICMYFCIKEKLLNKKQNDSNRYDDLGGPAMDLYEERAQ